MMKTTEEKIVWKFSSKMLIMGNPADREFEIAVVNHECNVALRTSNRKKSREFSQKRFIGTECTRFICIKSRERMRPRFVQMN
jgi:hypothetical protein